MLTEPPGWILEFGGGGTNGTTPSYIFHAGLSLYDAQGNTQPHLASKIPSLDDGDWVVFPDGRMEVTWKLRPGTRWHDGTALQAEDFVLGVKMIMDAELPLRKPPGGGFIAEAVAPDPETLVVRWKQPYILPNVSVPTDIVAVP